MKLQVSIAIAALLSTAAAQSLSDLPSCAKGCATTSIPTHCNSIDVKCICSDKSFISEASCCVASKCSRAEQAAIIKFAGGICRGAGVNDLPETASCANGSSTATGTATSTGTGTSTATATSDSGMTSAAATSTGGAAVVQGKDAGVLAALGAAAFAFL